MHEHLNNFQKILTDLLNIGKKVEKKTRTLVLFSLLFPFFGSLMAALVENNTIKMEEVTFSLLQKEVFRQENRDLSSGSDSFDGDWRCS